MIGEYEQPDKCFICEKQLIDPKIVYQGIEGGEVELSFGYGSKFDQCNGYYNRIYISAICDDCFEKKRKLFTQYTIEINREYKKVREQDYES